MVVLKMDLSITVRRRSTADGDVHMRQIRGSATVARSTPGDGPGTRSRSARRVLRFPPVAPPDTGGVRQRPPSPPRRRGFLRAQWLSVWRPDTVLAHDRRGDRRGRAADQHHPRLLAGQACPQARWRWLWMTRARSTMRRRVGDGDGSRVGRPGSAEPSLEHVGPPKMPRGRGLQENAEERSLTRARRSLADASEPRRRRRANGV